MYQNNLPFNPQQVQLGMLNLNLNNPPYCPNPRQFSPNIQPYVPLIAAMLAIEIQQRANQNPLRTFMFNMYAQNQFNNPDFEALVVAGVDYVALQMDKRIFQQVEQAIQICIPQLAEMVCAKHLRDFPALEQYVNPQMIQPLQQLIYQYDQIGNELSRGQQYGNAQPQTQMRTGWVDAIQSSGQGQNFSSGKWSGSNASGGSRSSGGSGLFTTSDTPHQDSSMARSFGGDRWQKGQTLEQPFESRKPVTQENNVVDVQPILKQKYLMRENVLKWVPTGEKPYIPAFNPMTHELYITIDNAGKPDLVLESHETVMDEERHTLTTVFGPLSREITTEHSNYEMMNLIAQGVEEIRNEREEIEQGRTERTLHVKQELLADVSLDVVWYEVMIDRLRIPGELPDVYRAFAQVADMVVTRKDESAAFDDLASAKTFIELREKLRGGADDISPELWNTVNQRMTDTVNRMIAQNLGIPGLSIEHFAEDIEALMNLLRKKYGDTVADAFAKHQKARIRSTLKRPVAEATKNLNETLIDGKFPEGEAPFMNLISSDYSLTYLNCIAHNLELELPKGIGAAVTSTITPELNELLKELFESTKGKDIERHLIRTLDNRILEASEGYLGEGFLLLTVVK